jgi:hypothetical protein
MLPWVAIEFRGRSWHWCTMPPSGSCDVLLIGSSDLTSELGIAGQMGHQKLIGAYQAVGDACRKHGKALMD